MFNSFQGLLVQPFTTKFVQQLDDIESRCPGLMYQTQKESWQKKMVLYTPRKNFIEFSTYILLNKSLKTKAWRSKIVRNYANLNRPNLRHAYGFLYSSLKNY